jgi:hypothetical protein
LGVAELIVTHLLAPGAPITVAVDDTLFRRRGKKVHGVGWFHDGSAAGQLKLGFGNNWVVAAIVVTLPFCPRPVALPVLASLAVKGGDRSKPDLARDLVDLIAERFPDRRIDLVADAAYGCGSFAGLGDDMTITTRARSNAAFYEPTPPRTGKRDRPRLKRGGPDRHSGRHRPLRNLENRGGHPLRHHRHSSDRRAHLPVVRHLAHRPRPRHPPARHRTHDHQRL